MAMVEQPRWVEKAMQHITRLWLGEFDRVSTLIESAGNLGDGPHQAIWSP